MRARDLELVQPCSRFDYAHAEPVFLRPRLVDEAAGIGVEGQTARDGRRAQLRCDQALHVHREPEAVEQLRPQLTLLRVHSADENETRGLTG